MLGGSFQRFAVNSQQDDFFIDVRNRVGDGVLVWGFISI